MLVSEFDFELPQELIAQEPAPERGSSRMLALSRTDGEWRDSFFENFPDLLHPGDVLVLNETRVIPARLFAVTRDGAQAEVLLTEQIDAWQWRVLARPARKLPPGKILRFGRDKETGLEAEVVESGEFGERTLRFSPVADFFSRLEELGHVPLPPYIRRPDHPADRERYQTVFARRRGSAAAPTAGLHFTSQTLDRIRAKGVTIRYLTLHVGLGTFQPVRTRDVASIHLHSERYELPEETANAINSAKRERRRVIAVGTTTVRAIEHCARSRPGAGQLEPSGGATSLFISPGFNFQIVDALLTNFHLPQSTLLMLVCAFAGREPVLAAYRHAVQSHYRFFSYGDCMFLS